MAAFAEGIEFSMYAVIGAAVLIAATTWAYRAIAESHPVMAVVAASILGVGIGGTALRDLVRRRWSAVTITLLVTWLLATLAVVVIDLALSLHG